MVSIDRVSRRSIPAACCWSRHRSAVVSAKRTSKLPGEARHRRVRTIDLCRRSGWSRCAQGCSNRSAEPRPRCRGAVALAMDPWNWLKRCNSRVARGGIQRGGAPHLALGHQADRGIRRSRAGKKPTWRPLTMTPEATNQAGISGSPVSRRQAGQTRLARNLKVSVSPRRCRWSRHCPAGP